jgi:hypothetical protein
MAFGDGDFRSAASRAYYAAYQGAAGVCVAHGDETQFPHNWRNPAHDQLPELIRKNGNLTLLARSQVFKALPSLRSAREDADYRPWIAIERADALKSLTQSINVLKLLEVWQDGAVNG